MTKKETKAYVDGSFNNKTQKAQWAYVIVEDETVIHQSGGVINDESVNEGRQVGGECQAVIKALQWAGDNNKVITVYFDFMGLMKWVADLFGEKPWQANKHYTKDYRRLVLSYRKYLAGFVKVKSHSGEKWNEYVDKLAGKAG